MFKEDDKVWCVLYGEGVVCSVNAYETYAVDVEFADGNTETYTKDGRLYEDRDQRMLFFSKPEVTGLTERPFDRTYQDGEHLIVVKKSDIPHNQTACETTAWSIVVTGEDEHYIQHIGRHGGTGSIKKSDFYIFKV